MGYSKQHVAATRRRILQSAGRLFRRHGYQGVGIDRIMEDAGLTRGGFYAHFKSKDDLLRAVMAEEELEFTQQLRDRREAGDARAAIDYYLDPRNRTRIGRGCTMVANAPDLARAGAATRKAFGEGFGGLVDEFEALAEGAPDARERALAAVATCIGGVTIARALGDDATALELLAACRDAVTERLSATSR